MRPKLITIVRFILLSIPFFLASNSLAQIEALTIDGKKVVLFNDGKWNYADSIPLYGIKPSKINFLEIPKVSPKEFPIAHLGYTLLYNEKHEQASWVAYELTKEETYKTVERTDKFQVDPRVKTGTATDEDYKGSGYDRGHLAPASDMGWSQSAMEQSFYYSNMSPQDPSFNRGIWKLLEELVRTWAVEYKSIYVVTGPVLKSGLKQIGPNKVSVPEYFYKILLDYTDPEVKAIGFIIPNKSSDQPLLTYAVTVDSVESFTGIDFFPSLPDDEENLIEKTLCLNCWTWAINTLQQKPISTNSTSTPHNTTINSTYQSSPSTTTGSQSVQCSGTTQSGSRCKRMTTSSSGRCYQH